MYSWKATIKHADMLEETQQDSVECATQTQKDSVEEDFVAHIKKEFDNKYNRTWHCIVGWNVSGCVTYETKHFIYFYLGVVAQDFNPRIWGEPEARGSL